MANEITSSTTSLDQEKYLASKLIQRGLIKLVAASLCDEVKMNEGMGLTANFIRYERMNVPLATLTEGTPPAYSPFTLSTVTVDLDQWGDVLALTDVAQLTTSHPLVQQAIELLSDNAQRVIDREIQIVWLAGTNVQYGDNSVTTRTAINGGMKVDDSIIHRARITMTNNQAPPRGGPFGVVLGGPGGGGTSDTKSARTGVGMNSDDTITQGLAYVAVCGAEVMADIMQAGTSLGTWAAVAMYANQKALYRAETGTWLGIRWVETNFIPAFSVLGNNTTAVASAAAFGTDTPVVTAVNGGGSLTSVTTFFYKVTRKSKLRGFEEEISIPHSTASAATGNNESFTFAFTGVDDGYFYSLYFDTEAAGGDGTDAKLRLVSDGIESGDTVTVTANPTTGDHPPAHPTYGLTVHPVYIHGNESTNWVGLQNLEVHTSMDKATTDNPLLQLKTIGYKFLAKAMIRDQDRVLRLEVCSAF